MTDNYKKEIARLFNYDIENNESWDSQKNSQREVVPTILHLLKRTRLSAHHFLSKYKNKIPEQETQYLLTEVSTIVSFMK